MVVGRMVAAMKGKALSAAAEGRRTGMARERMGTES